MADGEEKPELVSKGKLNALEEIVDDYVVDAGKKLVIFARFRPEIDIIGQMLKKKKLRYGEIYGDVKLEDRGDIVKDFQTNPETMVSLHRSIPQDWESHSRPQTPVCIIRSTSTMQHIVRALPESTVSGRRMPALISTSSQRER